MEHFVLFYFNLLLLFISGELGNKKRKKIEKGIQKEKGDPYGAKIKLKKNEKGGGKEKKIINKSYWEKKTKEQIINKSKWKN